MNLVLFDFDGTLTNKDSLLEFMRYTTPKIKLSKTISKYLLKYVSYKSGTYSGSMLKNELLSHMYKGISEEQLLALGEAFNNEVIPRILRKDTMEQLLAYQKQGDTVCIVSASIDIWLKPFANKLNVDCLCTHFEFKEGIFTGNFATPNCNHEEKRIRVEQQYTLSDFDSIIAYGDSKGDQHLFDMADKFYKV